MNVMAASSVPAAVADASASTDSSSSATTRVHGDSAELEVRLFGPPEVRVGGQPLGPLRGRSGLWALALLCLRAGREVERRWLAGTLWPNAVDATALSNLRRALTDLRTALGPAAADRIDAPTPHTLRLNVSCEKGCGVYIDVAVFDAATANLLGARQGEDITAHTEKALAEAVGLYRGPLLEGCAEDWILEERAAREQTMLRALEALALQARQRGDLSGARHLLRRALSLDPLNEPVLRTLIRTLGEDGDLASATQAYRDLRERLHAQMNVEPDPETTALYKELRQNARYNGSGAATTDSGMAAALPTSPIAVPISSNLPRPLTALVGRRAETERVKTLLESSRLVTLTGTGGVGKTRLALAVAGENKDCAGSDSRVRFVDLAPLAAEVLLEPAIGAALDLRETPGISWAETLVRHLNSQPVLLVLDNCEHLRVGCAALARTLLAACPRLHILATSRQPLGVSGEVTFRVPSLAVPELQERRGREKGDLAALLAYDAVRLFVERARAADANFIVAEGAANASTAAAVAALVHICRRLDGIPLAIEFAAARVRVLSLEQIAARLDDQFRLLSRSDSSHSGAQELPRHATLRATIDWSYALLTAPEKTLLRRLSVFAGGATLEAAEAVCSDEEIAAGDILDLMTGLVDKSLVLSESSAEPGAMLAPTGNAADRRFRMPEAVRQYASERLTEAGEVLALRAAHRAYYATLARTAEPYLHGAEQGAWLNRLEAEHDNLRAAFRSAGDEGTAGADQALLAAALFRFFMIRGHMSEGRAWCTEALVAIEAGRAPGLTPLLHAELLGGAAGLAFHAGDHDTARTLNERALVLRRAAGDLRGVAFLLNNLGQVATERGEFEEGRRLYHEALEIWRTLNDQKHTVDVLCNLGYLAQSRGDYAEARARYEEGLVCDRALGNLSGAGWTLCHLAIVARHEGQNERARMLMGEALTALRSVGHRRMIAVCLSNLGAWAVEERDIPRAHELLHEGLSLLHAIGLQMETAVTLGVFAELHMQEGRPERAAHLLGAQQSALRSLGTPLSVHEADAIAATTEAVRAALSPERFAAAYEAGALTALKDAVDLALAG